MLREACTWLKALLSDISVLKNFWTRDPVLPFHAEPHSYIAGARHHVKLQSTALLPPLKKKLACICAVLAKKVLFPKRISTNVRINISLYLDPITFSIYLLLGLIYFIFLNFYLFLAVLGFHFCEGFSVVAASGGYALVTVHGLLIAVAFLVVSTGSRARRLSSWGCGLRTVLVTPWQVGASQIRDWTPISCTGRWVLTTEPPGKPPDMFDIILNQNIFSLPSFRGWRENAWKVM